MMQMIVGTDGTVRMIYADEMAPVLAAMGEVTVKRASHVEPAPGGWAADMAPVGGPVLGPYALRSEALAAEVQWLQVHDLPVPA
jgi:hypothetical protein